MGDGTTTATVLAQALIHEGNRRVAAGANPMALKRGMDHAAEAVAADIARRARHLDGEDDLARVAALAAKDDDIGRLVADALTRVGKDGVILVEEGKSAATRLRLTQGIQIDRGYLSPYFVTDAERMEAVLEDAWVLLIDRKLSTAKEVLPVLQQVMGSGRSLLLVAEDVDGEGLATLVVNRLRGTLRMAAVKAPGFGNSRRDHLDDLAVLTGATVIREDSGRTLESVGLGDLGRASRVVVGKEETSLLDAAGDPEAIEARVESLRSQRDNADSEYDAEVLGKRLGRLTGGLGVIEVGGVTEFGLREEKARIEDALAAARAAAKEGVVPGGGLTLLRAVSALDALKLEGDQAVGVAVIRRGLEAPFRQIVENAGRDGGTLLLEVRARDEALGYDAAKNCYGDPGDLGVIDPAMVVQSAFRNAVSIAGLILTTQTLVAEVPDEPDSDEQDPPDSDSGETD